jgi:hypothetical protein
MQKLTGRENSGELYGSGTLLRELAHQIRVAGKRALRN